MRNLIRRNKDILNRSFILTLPVLTGYISTGAAFGLFASGHGYPWFIPVLLSIFLYAAASQFVAIGLFSAGIPLPQAALIIFLINARHMVYGISLIKIFRANRLRRPYMIFSLTDETYAILTARKFQNSFLDEEKPKAAFIIGALIHLYWITGTLAGSLAGTFIPFNIEGIDFALTSLFIVLALEHFEHNESRIFVISGAAAGLTGILFFGSSMLIPSIFIGSGILLFIKNTALNSIEEISEGEQ